MPFKVDFLPEYTDEKILEELRRLAGELGKKTLTKEDINSKGRVSASLLVRRFGSIRKALQDAGLVTGRFTKATDQELYDLLRNLWVMTLENEGRRPFQEDLKAYNFPVSSDTYIRRFGGWLKALTLVADSDISETTLSSLNIEPTSEARPPRVCLSIRKRFLVFKRDNYTCCICKRSGIRLEVDHIVPVEHGGTDSLYNLQTLCWDCNRGKRDTLQ